MTPTYFKTLRLKVLFRKWVLMFWKEGRFHMIMESLPLLMHEKIYLLNPSSSMTAARRDEHHYSVQGCPYTNSASFLPSSRGIRIMWRATVADYFQRYLRPVKPVISHVFVMIIVVRIIECFDHSKRSLFRIRESSSFSMMHYYTEYCMRLSALVKHCLLIICNRKISALIWLFLSPKERKLHS